MVEIGFVMGIVYYHERGHHMGCVSGTDFFLISAEYCSDWIARDCAIETDKENDFSMKI